jgi:hypothetical protein
MALYKLRNNRQNVTDLHSGNAYDWHSGGTRFKSRTFTGCKLLIVVSQSSQAKAGIVSLPCSLSLNDRIENDPTDSDAITVVMVKK